MDHMDAINDVAGSWKVQKYVQSNFLSTPKLPALFGREPSSNISFGIFQAGCQSTTFPIRITQISHHSAQDLWQLHWEVVAKPKFQDPVRLGEQLGTIQDVASHVPCNSCGLPVILLGWQLSWQAGSIVVDDLQGWEQTPVVSGLRCNKASVHIKCNVPIASFLYDTFQVCWSYWPCWLVGPCLIVEPPRPHENCGKAHAARFSTSPCVPYRAAVNTC